MRSGQLPLFNRSKLLNRVLLLYVGLLIWSGTIVTRLVYLQVVQGPAYRDQAKNQQKGFLQIASRRGNILDRNLEELAVSLETETVSCNPDQIVNPVQTAQLLAPILEENRDALYQKLTAQRSYVRLKRKVSPRVVARVKELNLAGIHTKREYGRYYVNQRLGAQVLGFVGVDGVGLSGLEYRFNDSLQGQEVEVPVLVDAHRTSIERAAVSKDTEGNLLVLTLDRTLQHIAEEVLAEAASETGARWGAAILMQPFSGEVLAMASWPGFDPNSYQDYATSSYRNRAILENYEPGSTFKIISLAAVLNEGLSHLEELVDCRVGTVQLAGKIYREAKHSFEDLTFQEILAKSSNVGTVSLGLRLGEQRLYDYIRRFGFGQKTGIELPGEEDGLLRPPSEWSKISIGALSIGQELAVTPLQMIRAAAVFANGGYLVKPFLADRILDSEGNLIQQTQPESRRVLPEETVGKLVKALTLVVEEGTGAAGRLNGYTAAGKTGTAQKIVDGLYSRTKYIASFVGFAPVNDPALIALIVIDEPDGTYYGGHVAAPVFKRLMERSLIRLGVPMDRPEDRRRVDESMVQLVEGEPKVPLGISVEDQAPLSESGLDETVLSLLKEDPQFQHDGAVTVELDTVTVPDFSGLSLREVARRSARLGLRLRHTGSGVAISQRPDPGRTVGTNTVCEVFFSAARY